MALPVHYVCIQSARNLRSFLVLCIECLTHNLHMTLAGTEHYEYSDDTIINISIGEVKY